MKQLQLRNIFGRKVSINTGDSGNGVENISVLPETGEVGKIYYNTDDNKYYTYDADLGFIEFGSKPKGIEIVDDNNIRQYYHSIPEQGITSIVDIDLYPNKLYLIGEKHQLTLYVQDQSETEAVSYYGRFTVGSGIIDGETVTLTNIIFVVPEGAEPITIADNAPEFELGHTYEFNIFHNQCSFIDITTTVDDNDSQDS